MKTHYAIALAMLAGFGLGTVAVQGLHAQAKPPVYQVTEIEILDPEAYSKDYVPKARAAIQARDLERINADLFPTDGPRSATRSSR